ncbi:MAG: hypothetical protein WCW77_02765 [Patescibacteria group bacterium]|jgi:hypothetical protein
MRRRRKLRIFLSKSRIISSLAILGALLIVASVQPKEEARTAAPCPATPINSSTLLKTYHLLDLTDGFGVSPAKDGGFFVAGDTIPAAGMAAPYPFIFRTNLKGDLSWSRWFSSQSLALGAMSSRRIGRITVETSDNNIIMASDVLDFVDENKKELYGDILVTKLNSKGGLIWSLMLGNHSQDRPRKMWALPDGGVMILGRFLKTGYGNGDGDTDTIPRYSALIKVDKNGKVQTAKKFGWEAEDMERLADGSYIALANIEVPKTVQPKNILGPEVVPHALPTIVRLDSKLNVAWAKSLEMIPSEINAPTSYASSTLTIGKTKIRLAGGDFRAVKPTPDGGFLAFGYENLILTTGLNAGVSKEVTSFTVRAFIAVKVDKAGKYQWAKKLTVNLPSSAASNDFQVVKTADNKFVIMQDVIHDLAAGFTKTALASNIELIKIDPDINPVWVKKIEAERDLSGYGIAATADKGVVISASMLTTKQHMVMLSLEPYKEAALIKVDVNGKVEGYVGARDFRGVSLEDQSQYLVMNSMDAGKIADLKLSINKKVKEKLPAIKNTARNISPYKKSFATPVCSFLTQSASGQPATNTAKTWALINYENTKAAAVEGDKNQTVNDELLPMLNQLFANQVRLKDNMKSMWLTYIFPRLVTRADVEAVENKYKELGYKIDESEGGRLYVSRVGLTLHMTFSIDNSMMGKLEVLF